MLHWLSDAVELHDQSLKSLKGSAAYSDINAKVRCFHAFLGSYLNAMLAWAEAVPALADHRYDRGGCLKEMARYYEKYATKGDSLNIDEMKPKDAVEALRPSGSFLVAAAQLGCGADLMGNESRTLEDLFTLIHQNLLMICAAAQKESGLKSNILPSGLRELSAAFSKASELLGVDYSYPRLILEFNRSLKAHSLKSRVEYDLREPRSVRFSMTLYGEEEHNRHSRCKMYAALFGRSIGVPYAFGGAPKPGEKSSSWTWDVPLQGEAADTFRRALPFFVDEVAETTSPERSGHHKLGDVVDRLRKIVPRIDEVLRTLDYAFFKEHPWFNAEFSGILSDSENLGDALLGWLEFAKKDKCDVATSAVARAVIARPSKIKPALRGPLALKLRERWEELPPGMKRDRARAVEKAIRCLGSGM